MRCPRCPATSSTSCAACPRWWRTAGPRAQSARIAAITDRYRRRLPAHPADRVRLVAGARAGRHAVGRAGRGDRRRPAGRRLARAAHRARRPAARARGLLAAAPGRGRVPRCRRGRRHLRGRPRRARRARARSRDVPGRHSPAGEPLVARRTCRSPTPAGTTRPWPRLNAVHPGRGAHRGHRTRAAAASPRCWTRWPGCCPLQPDRSTRGRARRSAAPRWQRQVAWLPQRPHFVAGTVADNLRLGRPDAPPTRAVGGAAPGRARGAGPGPAPTALDSRLGEDGATLSAGRAGPARAGPHRASPTGRGCSSTSRPRTSTS